jgi:hypothetical protein
MRSWAINSFYINFLALVGSIFALEDYRAYEFGSLNPASGLRLAIPSILSFPLGAQLIFASFFLGVLQIKIKR